MRGIEETLKRRKPMKDVPNMGAPSLGSPIADALFGKTRLGVLALLFTHPDETFHMRHIAREVGAGQGAVQRELRRFDKPIDRVAELLR